MLKMTTSKQNRKKALLSAAKLLSLSLSLRKSVVTDFIIIELDPVFPIAEKLGFIFSE
jgi:hypothetical protein